MEVRQRIGHGMREGKSTGPEAQTARAIGRLRLATR